MAVRNIFQPWKSYFVTHITFATMTLRLIIFMQIANIMLALPTKGQESLVVTGRVLSQIAGGLMATDVPRTRCKCHSQATKHGSQAQAQDLSMYWENSDESLQLHLRLSAYISHNQKSSAVLPLSKSHHSQSNGETGGTEEHSGEVSENPNGSKSSRRHSNLDNMWDDISTDENVRGQIILEHTWSVKWGQCLSHVCDERTCRRATLRVACVGPCRWYRRHKCPKRFGGFCVTTRDDEGCNYSHDKGDHQDSKFPIVKIDQDKGRDNQGVEDHDGDDDDDDGDDDNSDDKDGGEDVDDNGEEVRDDKHIELGPLDSNSVPPGMRKDYDEGVKSEISHEQTTPTLPTLPTGAGTDHIQMPRVTEAVIWQVTSSSQDAVHTRNGFQQSDVVQSGIRYLWVVSCVVVPTLVFCIGYAIALHLRRRRFLLNAQSSRPPTEGASDPFLSTTAAPPYSVEDIFTCPSVISSLNFPPPSYEDAMSVPELPAEQRQTLSACSEYLSRDRQLVVSCPTVLSPLMEPPPYVESAPLGPPSGVTLAHTRLPSYHSAICLHTSI